MKNTLALATAMFVVCLSANARITYEHSIKGALAKVKFRVVDQDGVIVSDAKIWGAFTANRMRDSVLIEGMTNTNGEFVAKGNCNEFLRVDVTKEGYYHTEVKVHLWRSKADPIVVDGKWQPYGETRTVVLKKIREMGVLSVPNMDKYSNRERKIPKFDCWLPFDLEKFDWTAPYGKGVCSDVLLRLHNRTTSNLFDYTDRMEICFTNNPFAGVYEVEKDASSDMKTVYAADSNAVYKSQLTFVCERTSDNRRTENYLNEDAYLVFRTRTVVDEQGKLKSAHYGVIYGPWLSAGDHVCFTDGCFNPHANNLNIEDSYYLREEVRHYNGSNKTGAKCER